jgi:predicted transcriptional regulator
MNDRNETDATRYSEYRSSIEIMGSILWSIKKAPKRKTELMEGIGITSNQFDRYVAWLSDSDIGLARIDEVGHKRVYVITDKGQQACRAYEQLMSLIEKNHPSDEP